MPLERGTSICNNYFFVHLKINDSTHRGIDEGHEKTESRHKGELFLELDSAANVPEDISLVPQNGTRLAGEQSCSSQPQSEGSENWTAP